MKYNSIKIPKAILFLSLSDFKEKSIQVIRKTPEAYVNSGWKVYYIVGRDISRHNNYFYERVINLKGVTIFRFIVPLTKLINSTNNKNIIRILNKIRYWLAIVILIKKAIRIISRNIIHVIYGYGFDGAFALHLLKIMGKLKNIKTVTRFQGTFFHEHFKNKRIKKIIFRLEHLLALYLPSDLCIMTNDGTQGDKALKDINSKNLKNMKFWVNGVDNQILNKEKFTQLKEKIKENSKSIFLTVGRLVVWKRIDRVIDICNTLVHKHNFKDFKYYIIGDGIKRKDWEKLVHTYNLEKYIVFIGAVNHKEVMYYMHCADIFFSTYDSSNIGNPLLEAIRSHRIIFTLDNGDTSSWIKHKENGFIYPINKNLIDQMAQDVIKLLNNKELQKTIIKNIIKTEKAKLWTWEERFQAEINEVKKLLE